MRSTLEDCFRELVRDEISNFLGTMYSLDDEDINMFVEDPYELKETIIRHFRELGGIENLYNTDVECFNIINNDVRIFQEMIEYIQTIDEDYEYDGIVMNMFRFFLDYWIRDAILTDESSYNDMIMEELETESTERDRRKEIKQLMPLIINRLTIPNELTQSIMLMVGERC